MIRLWKKEEEYVQIFMSAATVQLVRIPSNFNDFRVRLHQLVVFIFAN